MKTRRDFVMTSLMTGFTLAAARAEAAAIHTDEAGLLAGEVSISTRAGEIPAYRAQPQGAGPFPVVLVIEEIFGVHEYIKDVCRRLAKLGYLAVAPELYARLGDLSAMTDPQEIVTKIIMKAPDVQVISDLNHTLDWAVSHQGDEARMAVLGFCRGGRDVWLFAEQTIRLKAAVAFYGPVKGPVTAIQPDTPLDLAYELKAPLLGLYGGADDGINIADVQEAASRARKRGTEVHIEVFPGAPHGFHADYRATYHESAAKAAWGEALAWFRSHGVI